MDLTEFRRMDSHKYGLLMEFHGIDVDQTFFHQHHGKFYMLLLYICILLNRISVLSLKNSKSLM